MLVSFSLSMFNSSSSNSNSIQQETMPTASESYENKIVQYVGQTNTNYTNAYFYKCNKVLMNTPSAESLVVTQTAGVNMGTFTTDVNVFKAALNPNQSWTFQFSCIGKPRIISLWKYENGMQTESFTRDSTFDIAQLHQFGWVDDGNNWYFTNTEFPDESTIFYNGDTDEIGTPTNINSNWIYMATTGRQTAGMGIWVIGGNEDPISLSDYGIYCSSSGLIGDVLSVAYTQEVLPIYNHIWQQINVQP